MKRHTGILFTSALMLGGLVAINSVSALSYESEQGLSFTLNPTIRVTLSSDTMAINDLAPGTTSDSSIIKATIESNAVAGYTLSSTVGNSTTYNTTNMVHTNGTNTFTNLSSNKASLASFDPSTWGYSYAPCTTVECANTPSWISGDITGTTNSGYNGLPLYSTANPIKLINATTPGSSAVQFKFGAKADTAQLAGTYNNVINFIGVGKIITTQYTINYNANGGSGAPAQETGSSTTGAVQISSTQPTRTNYLFKGWCTEQTSNDTCSGETVQPGGMLALHPGTTNLTPTVTRALYAMWKDNSPAPPLPEYCTDTATCMQTSTACDTTLTDGRDGNTYTVATIASTCWMTQNLRFQGTDLKVGESDVTSDVTMTYGQLSSGNSYTEARIATGSTTDYGTYYNYCAASAGEVCSDSVQQDATRSVCPTGWKLPTQAQLNAVPSKDSHFTASSGLAGYYGAGMLSYAGSYGFWWASTANSATRQYHLYYSSDYDVWGVSDYYKFAGSSVRCVRAA